MTKAELIKALEGLPDDVPVRFGKGLRDSIAISGVRLCETGDYEDGMVSYPKDSKHHFTSSYLRLEHSSERMLIWMY